jgi:hypothetical protein
MGLIADSTTALMAPIIDDEPVAAAAFDDAPNVTAAFDDTPDVAAAMANLGLWCVPGVGSLFAEPFLGLVLVSDVFVVSDASACFDEVVLVVFFVGDFGYFYYLQYSSLTILEMQYHV